MKFIKLSDEDRVINLNVIIEQIESIVGWVINKNGDCIITFNDGDIVVISNKKYDLFIKTIENINDIKHTNHIIDKLAMRAFEKYSYVKEV